jgi:hypothetical protein
MGEREQVANGNVIQYSLTHKSWLRPAPPGLPQLLALLCSGTRDGAAVGFQARERRSTMVRSISS